LAEFIDHLIDAHSKYGIAAIQPNRALKKCKTRKLIVEYFLSEIGVFFITPKPCVQCDRKNECTDDFVLQIIEKYNYGHRDTDDYYLLG
jgi:hypothetical protein